MLGFIFIIYSYIGKQQKNWYVAAEDLNESSVT